MENNFNLKKFLIENKLTSNSRLLSEQEIDIDSVEQKYHYKKVPFDRFFVEEGHTGAVIADIYREDRDTVWMVNDLSDMHGEDSWGIYYENLNFDQVFHTIYKLGGSEIDQNYKTIYYNEDIGDYLDSIGFNDKNPDIQILDQDEEEE